MSDIPDIDTRTAELIGQLDTRDPVATTRKGVPVHRVNIPQEIHHYPIPNRQSADAVFEQLESILKFYVGEWAFSQIKKRAEGNNTKVLPYFRLHLWNAMENWDFDALGATEKRSKKDDSSSESTQKQLIELLTFPVWTRLCQMARERQVSNLDALKVGVTRCVEKGVL